MLKACSIVAAVALMAFGPAYAQETADKAQEWCTDAHMAEMDGHVSKITDPAQKKSVMKHLDLSKASFKKNDMSGCVMHMAEAHKAMGHN